MNSGHLSFPFGDVVVPDHLLTVPTVPMTAYHDLFGNWIRPDCCFGGLRLSGRAIVNDAGKPDPVFGPMRFITRYGVTGVTLVFLLGSRYWRPTICWRSLGDRSLAASWMGPRAGHLRLRKQPSQIRIRTARPTKTAWEAYQERTGGVQKLRPLGDHILPLHEYSGTLLHRVSG